MKQYTFAFCCSWLWPNHPVAAGAQFIAHQILNIVCKSSLPSDVAFSVIITPDTQSWGNVSTSQPVPFLRWNPCYFYNNAGDSQKGPDQYYELGLRYCPQQRLVILPSVDCPPPNTTTTACGCWDYYDGVVTWNTSSMKWDHDCKPIACPSGAVTSLKGGRVNRTGARTGSSKYTYLVLCN